MMRPVKHILFIDDDLISNVIHEKIIQSIRPGIDVKACMDSTKALHHLKYLAETDQYRFPDIIFLDLNMPEMSGWEFLGKLKQFPEFIFKECSVYMLTSSIDNGDIEKAKEFSILRDFISKPLSINRMETLFSSQHDFVN